MNKYYIYRLIFFVLILFSPLVIVYLLFAHQISFVSYKFTEEYWKFIGGLISVAFGFYLVNILWTNREKLEITNQTKMLLFNYILRINVLSKRAINLLNRTYDEAHYDESTQRDINILHLTEKIQKVSMAIENTPMDIKFLKDQTIMNIYTELIWGELLPTIERLSSLKNIRTHYDDFLYIVNEIETLTKKLLKELS